MKRFVLAAAFLASVTGVALANDIDPNGFQKEHFVTSATRAEVSAELKAAQAKGEVGYGEVGAKVQSEPSTKTRAQVAAEARHSAHRYGETAEVQ
jgi:opacity protein-like surface antigen